MPDNFHTKYKDTNLFWFGQGLTPDFLVKLLDKSGCISANEQVLFLCIRFALILKLLKSFGDPAEGQEKSLLPQNWL